MGTAPALIEPRAAPSAAPPLEEWVARFGAELGRRLARILGSEDDADDVLQQVWLAAHRDPPDAGPGTNVRAWLYRVATNAALDRLAGERRRAAALAARGHTLAPEEGPRPDAGTERLGARARQLVRERVAELPRKQREAVWLRCVEGLDYPAIGARLRCSAESARANVYQGIKRLRRELRTLWNEEHGG